MRRQALYGSILGPLAAIAIALGGGARAAAGTEPARERAEVQREGTEPRNGEAEAAEAEREETAPTRGDAEAEREGGEVEREEAEPPSGEAGSEKDASAGGPDHERLAPVTVRGRRQRERGLRDLASEESLAKDALRALEEAEFSTLIRAEDSEGESRTLADVLDSSVGARVRGMGGLGAFSSLSVRGGASGHTPVFVDGVPQPRIASATADLGQLELGTFSDVELYRGTPPAHLGGSTLGGALHLQTAVGEPPGGDRLALSAGGGSFGARHARVRYLGGREEELAYHISAGYGGATGDFPFYDDRGTNLSPDDSEISRRQNNAYDRGDVVARARARRGAYRVEGGGRVSFQDQGIPGPGHRQSEETSLGTLAAQLDGELEVEEPWDASGARARVSSYGRVERQRYRDREGEVGLGAQDMRYLTGVAGARAGLEVPIGSSQVLSSGVSARLEAFDEGRRLRGARGARGARLSLGADFTDAIHLAGDRVLLRPGLRLDVQHTAPLRGSGDASAGADGELARRTDLHPSPRVAARVRPARALALKASAGWYFRAPTVYELFGDRGALVGNPELRPETGPSADAGFVVAPGERYASVFDRLLFEAVGFAKRPRDAIVFARRSALVSKATNLGGALIYGGELRGSARLARTVTLSGNYTFVESRQRSARESYDGQRLPNRPRHEAYGRIDAAREVFGRLASIWADGTYAAGNYLDRGNFREVPARVLFGAGIKAELVPGLLLGAEVKNATDRRTEALELSPPPAPDLTEVPAAIADVHGHPLPGRAGYVSLKWRP